VRGGELVLIKVTELLVDKQQTISSGVGYLAKVEIVGFFGSITEVLTS